MASTRNISILFMLCAAVCTSFGPKPDAKPELTSKQEKKLAKLLSKMTLEQKAGQMTNISLMALAEGEFWMKRDTIRLDTAKMRALLLEAHVGSVQNLGTYPLSPAEWRKYINILQDLVRKKTSDGIPILYGIDAVHGANYTAGSTLFPQQLALAATWNPALAEEAGRITSYEIKASGIPWNYAPVLDVSKQPLWGRIFETFGEDTYLTTMMGNAMIRGMQGEDLSSPYSSAVCLKHFLGYGQPANGKDRSPTYLPERMLRQTYLPPFSAAIDQGAMTVMLNSGSVNGIPSHADHNLITNILKGELGFEGLVISDWEDIMNLVKTHQVARDEKDAVRISVNAGLDMCMEPYDASFAKYLVELVNEGKVPMARIDDAVERILRVKILLGLFDEPLTDPSLYSEFGSEAFAESSFNAAVESMTLLKNEAHVLPLKKDNKVLITGVAAHSINYLNGAWSRTWSGVDTTFNDPGKMTIRDAIASKVGHSNLTYIEGTTYTEDINTGEAVREATDADIVVICLGEKPATEKPSDIDNLEMPQAQLDLVKAISETGKPIVVVLVEARPRIISQIEPLVAGILMTYLPGNEGGRAVADVLYGEANPSGKLPITYPRYSGSIWSYDHTKADQRDAGFGYDGFKPQFEFGYGLSYSTFSYENLTLDKDTLHGDETITATINVTNTGKITGKEVVQLYSSDLVASIVPAVKQLKRFEKIELNPGETKTVSFQLNKNDLAFVDQNQKWVTEPGDFVLQIDTMRKSFYYSTINDMSLTTNNTQPKKR